jgi:hypothetical protein
MGTFMSPESKKARERALEKMRVRFMRKTPTGTLPPKRASKKKRAKRRTKPAPPKGRIADALMGLAHGESVWIETDSKSIHAIARKLKSSLRLRRRFTTRTSRKGGVMGVRIWRGKAQTSAIETVG